MSHCTHCENVNLSAESPTLTAVAMAHGTATKTAGYFTVYSKYTSCRNQFLYLQKMTKNQLNAAK
jgi:hypothetical protein